MSLASTMQGQVVAKADACAWASLSSARYRVALGSLRPNTATNGPVSTRAANTVLGLQFGNHRALRLDRIVRRLLHTRRSLAIQRLLFGDDFQHQLIWVLAAERTLERADHELRL